METIINIKVKLDTLDEVTKKELDKIQIDASQISNLITYEVLEVKREQ